MYNTGELLAAHWLNTASGVLVEEKEKVNWRNRGVTPTLPPHLARDPEVWYILHKIMLLSL